MAKKRKPTNEEIHSVLLVADVAKTITPLDCAAHSVLVFSRGEAPEEWQQRGVEAMRKFTEFGWAMFHAIGGLNIDWDKAAENAVLKLKDKLPQKPAAAPKKRPAKKP